MLVRIPVIPGVNDDQDEMNRIGAFLAGLPKRHPVELLAYHDIAAAKYDGLDREYMPCRICSRRITRACRSWQPFWPVLGWRSVSRLGKEMKPG